MAEGVLLDTCIVVDNLLGVLDLNTKAQIDQFPKRYVSVATAWEIDLKPELRDLFPFEMLRDAFRNMGTHILPITLDDVATFRSMRRYQDHHDHFDRVLIAQAYIRKLAIATYDKKFQRYPLLELLGSK